MRNEAVLKKGVNEINPLSYDKLRGILIICNDMKQFPTKR